jgi:RNA polymerase sigma-70 factor (ECF subfamily)
LNPHHKTKEDLQLELSQIDAAKLNPDAFAVLYEKYYKQIFLFIFRRTGEEDLTADLCSVSFLKAMVSIKKYEYRGVPFSAWLFRIALNEINMYYRKSQKERFVSLDSKGVLSLASESADGYSEEQQKRLMLALSKLNADDMQLIELRFFENRSFAEVAEISGITENHAKVKVYRILDKLKTFLKGSRN